MNINPICFNCLSFILNDCDGTGLNSVTECVSGRFHFLCFEPVTDIYTIPDPFFTSDFLFLGYDFDDDSY